MEKIHVWRGPTITDPYGNPIQGDPVPVAEYPALVAPNHPSEPVQVGRTAVITGYTIYIEGAEPTGIRDTDLIEVRSPAADNDPIAVRRGHLLPVDGMPASWFRRDGSYKGDQLAVKVVDG